MVSSTGMQREGTTAFVPEWEDGFEPPVGRLGTSDGGVKLLAPAVMRWPSWANWLQLG